MESLPTCSLNNPKTNSQSHQIREGNLENVVMEKCLKGNRIACSSHFSKESLSFHLQTRQPLQKLSSANSDTATPSSLDGQL